MAFDYSTIFAAGELGEVWLADGTHYQDAARTVVAGDGDLVGSLSGDRGNFNAQEDVSSRNPTLRQDAGGKWYLDHNEDRLLVGTTSDFKYLHHSTGNEAYVCIALRIGQIADPNTKYGILGTVKPGGQFNTGCSLSWDDAGLDNNNALRLFIYPDGSGGPGYDVQIDDVAPPLADCIIEIFRNGTAISWHINGNLIHSGTQTSTSSGDHATVLALGATNAGTVSGTLFFTGRFYGILITDTVPSAADRLAIQSDMDARLVTPTGAFIPDAIDETSESIALFLGDAEETIGVGVIVETAEGITSLWGDATELAADPVIETAEGVQLLLSDTEDTIALTETAEGIQRLLGDVTDVAVSEADETAEGLQLLLTDVVDTITLEETAEGIQFLLGDVEDEAATGFAELDAELPNLEATIHQGALFSAELPQIDGDFRAYAGATATLDALLPNIEAAIQTAHKINAELPSLQAELQLETDQPLSLDAELPALNATFNLQVDISPTLNAELPALEAAFVTAHKLSATLPALQAALSLPVSGVISLSAALPSLYFDASVVTDGTATLDATLPALEARSILLELVAELPALTARISSSTLVETLTKTAYALNTETGALTDFANFQFLKLGTLNGKLYGLTSAGRLVRLEGDTDNGEPILGYLLTHSDDRIYNDIGELVRTDYLRRCYGVYLKSRNLQGVQVELINDELDKITYPVMPQMRDGLVNYRVDTYRGIMSHYWALGLRTQGGHFDLFSAALILESLDRKVW